MVIIGASAAGIAAAEAIRFVDRSSSITMISEEGFPPYCRIFLPEYVTGRAAIGSISVRDPGWFKEMGVDLVCNKKACLIQPARKRVILADGRSLDYDKCLVATGAVSRPLGVPGEALNAVTSVRFLREAQRLRARLPGVNTAIVIGGGPLGVKVVHCLREAGKDVMLVVSSSAPLARVLDETGCKIIGHLLESHGVEVLARRRVVRIAEKNPRSGRNDVRSPVVKVEFEDGGTISGDLVVVAKGVLPNVPAFDKSPAIGRTGGIVVDELQRTEAPDLYAAGDVAEIWGTNLATWTSAVEQGRIAGLNMAGEEVRRGQMVVANVGQVFGTCFARLSLVRKPEAATVTRKRTPSIASHAVVAVWDGVPGEVTMVGTPHDVGAWASVLSNPPELSWEAGWALSPKAARWFGYVNSRIGAQYRGTQ